jgi:hypothetical protein
VKSTRGASELFLDTPSKSGSEPRRCLRAEIALLIAQMRQDILLPVKDSYWDSEVADRRSRAPVRAKQKAGTKAMCGQISKESSGKLKTSCSPTSSLPFYVRLSSRHVYDFTLFTAKPEPRGERSKD